MCGIAGYSLSPSSRVDRTLAAQTLLAAIAERGSDAVGYAYRSDTPGIAVRKRRGGAGGLLDEMSVPVDATQLLVHVRDYTKGHPSIEANNHPIRHGSVVGIHNGIVFNDEEILDEHGFDRAHPEMTVDSEAIFALAEEFEGRASAFEQCRGSMAVAWLDSRRPDVLFLARGGGRPLWAGACADGTFFASTRRALEIVERFLRLRLHKVELPEGSLVALVRGLPAWEESWTPRRDYEERGLPSVRAAGEGELAMQRLAAIVAATTAY
jgi:glucosamine 6-phosphate synthetase-like amidotransferase/phosphosugar isomerase protein